MERSSTFISFSGVIVLRICESAIPVSERKKKRDNFLPCLDVLFNLIQEKGRKVRRLNKKKDRKEGRRCRREEVEEVEDEKVVSSFLIQCRI